MALTNMEKALRAQAKAQAMIEEAQAEQDEQNEVLIQQAQDAYDKACTEALEQLNKARASCGQVPRTVKARTGANRAVAGATAHARQRISEGHLSTWYINLLKSTKGTGDPTQDKAICAKVYTKGWIARRGTKPSLVDRYTKAKAQAYLIKK